MLAMKRLLSVLLLGAVCTFAACDNVGECGPFKSKIRTTGFIDGAFQVEPDTEFGFDTELAEIEDDTLAAGELVLQLRLRGELYAENTPHRHRPAFQLIPAAYACSPPIPLYEAMIQDIRIFSNTALGEDYPAGENLVALFDIVGRPALGMPYERQALTDFLEQMQRPVDELLFVLNEVSAEPTELQFTVEYEQEGEGEEEYTFTTDPIFLGAE